MKNVSNFFAFLLTKLNLDFDGLKKNRGTRCETRKFKTENSK